MWWHEEARGQAPYNFRARTAPGHMFGSMNCTFSRCQKRVSLRYCRNHSLDGATLFSKLDSNKLRFNIKNEMTLIYAKFDADLINIFKVTSRKTKWPRFFWPTRYVTERRTTGIADARFLQAGWPRNQQCQSTERKPSDWFKLSVKLYHCSFWGRTWRSCEAWWRSSIDTAASRLRTCSHAVSYGRPPLTCEFRHRRHRTSLASQPVDSWCQRSLHCLVSNNSAASLHLRSHNIINSAWLSGPGVSIP